MKEYFVSTYEVYDRTLALIPNKDPEYQTKVYETSQIYYVKEPPLRIIERSAVLTGPPISAEEIGQHM